MYTERYLTTLQMIYVELSVLNIYDKTTPYIHLIYQRPAIREGGGKAFQKKRKVIS